MTKRIVILGAGFSGASVAHGLSTLLLSEDDCSITLVDENNFLLFTPLLAEVVGGEVDPRDAVAPIRSLSPRITFEQGRVDEVDIEAKRVLITVGDGQEDLVVQRTLHADQIVIALGSVTNFHHIPGAEKHCLTIKSIAEATAIRDRALALLSRASIEDDLSTRRKLLTFVVAGGGFSGVETMAALNDFVRGDVRMYPRLRSEEIRTLLAQPGDRLLPELSADLASYARKELEKRGVEVCLNTEIKSVGSDCVELGEGSESTSRSQTLDACLCVWAAGVEPNPLVKQLNLSRGHHGGIEVDGCCRVKDHPGVWALGDCAEVPKPGGDTYPPTAQDATREGAHVARNIIATLRGESPTPFNYKPAGELALVGRRAGVANVYGVHLSGLPAWALWRGVYLAKMPTTAKRVRVAIDWLLDLVFGRDLSLLPQAAPAAGSGKGSSRGTEPAAGNEQSSHTETSARL